MAVKNMRFGKLTAILMVALLVSPSLVIAEEAVALTVVTDEYLYEPGDEVEISGTAEPNSEVNVTISDGTKEIFKGRTLADEEGNFSVEFKLLEEAVAGAYTVAASIFEASADASFVVVDMELKELAEELLDMAEELRDDLDELLDLLEERGVEVPPEILEDLDAGVQTLEEAEGLMENEEYGATAEKARDALEILGGVFESAEALVPEEGEPPEGEEPLETEEPEEPEDDVERGIGLYVAIDMALRFIDKVNVTVDRLIDEGYEFDYELIRGRLEEAEDALIALRDKLDSLESDASIADIAQELARIRGYLGETNGLLHSTAVRQHKQEMAEKFMGHVQNRIRSLNETILKLRERLEAEKMAMVGHNLGVVSRKIERLRERLSTDEVDELLGELEDAVEEIEDNLDELNGRGTSSNLKAMNMVEARIRVLRNTAERLRRKGEETSGVDEELENAAGLLERMRERLEEGENVAAQELLDEVSRKFDELRGEIRPPIANQIREKIIEQIHKKLQENNGKGSSTTP
jgi:hypothetical protein